MGEFGFVGGDECVYLLGGGGKGAGGIHDQDEEAGALAEAGDAVIADGDIVDGAVASARAEIGGQ